MGPAGQSMTLSIVSLHLSLGKECRASISARILSYSAVSLKSIGQTIVLVERNTKRSVVKLISGGKKAGLLNGMSVVAAPVRRSTIAAKHSIDPAINRVVVELMPRLYA